MVTIKNFKLFFNKKKKICFLEKGVLKILNDFKFCLEMLFTTKICMINTKNDKILVFLTSFLNFNFSFKTAKVGSFHLSNPLRK